MPIQAALHQALGVAPPLAYIPPHLRQQQAAHSSPNRPTEGLHNRKQRQQKNGLATWNLRSGRNSGIQQAILDIKALNLGVTFATSTGLTGKKNDPYNNGPIHTRHFEGYSVDATEANSPTQGGVAFIYKDPRPGEDGL